MWTTYSDHKLRQTLLQVARSWPFLPERMTNGCQLFFIRISDRRRRGAGVTNYVHVVFTSGDWSISAIFSGSAQRAIEHGSIGTNELNMTLMSHMTHHDLV